MAGWELMPKQNLTRKKEYIKETKIKTPLSAIIEDFTHNILLSIAKLKRKVVHNELCWATTKEISCRAIWSWGNDYYKAFPKFGV